MNTSTQAQKGFKTFVLTLVVSLVIFSAIYYIINSGTSKTNESIQDVSQTSLESTKPAEAAVAKNASAEEATTEQATTLGVSTESLDETSKEPAVEEKSVFSDLVNQKPAAQPRGVLSGTETATTTPSAGVSQTTVPDTGIAGPTVGLIISSLILGFGIYIIFLGPRKIALSAFEKKVLKGLK